MNSQDPELRVTLTHAPLESVAVEQVLETYACGSVLEFSGKVRPLEQGRPIRGIVYEVYEEMAKKVISDIVCSLQQTYPVDAVGVWHRYGFVAVGEAAIYVAIASAHRQEGIGFLADFMNVFKEEVPIWKAEVVYEA